MQNANDSKNGNVRDLCKMVRAWRNKHGQEMGGLLVDTLVYQFLQSTTEYDDTSYSDHHRMVRDFFEYLTNEPKDKEYYGALGSGQRVKIKKKFHRKAKQALEAIDEAIASQGQRNCNDKWRRVFGTSFPAALPSEQVQEATARTWDNTEEFIEDQFPVDIRYDLQIDCNVSQDGFRTHGLRDWLTKRLRLAPKKKLEFHIAETDVPEPYSLKWKVLNRGDEARRRNEVRGQIHNDSGRRRRTENTKFLGEHIVECYALKDGVVVARDRIRVPIESSES